jgi:hypothetical protein
MLRPLSLHDDALPAARIGPDLLICQRHLVLAMLTEVGQEGCHAGSVRLGTRLLAAGIVCAVN